MSKAIYKRPFYFIKSSFGIFLKITTIKLVKLVINSKTSVMMIKNCSINIFFWIDMMDVFLDNKKSLVFNEKWMQLIWNKIYNLISNYFIFIQSYWSFERYLCIQKKCRRLGHCLRHDLIFSILTLLFNSTKFIHLFKKLLLPLVKKKNKWPFEFFLLKFH